jgi:glycosyltransferase involved in cell wall biosynthesis
MSPPFVSVLVDTYNHEHFIEPAIVSVLEQDFPASDREVIVVDDGSTDRTPEIVRKFVPHVRLLRKPNGGQASAFNAGIPECRGELIAFLDGDDWWAPGKLSRVSQLMASDPALGVLGHAIVESFDDGTERIISAGAQKRFRLDNIPAAHLFRLNRCYLGTSRLTMRSSIARKILPVPESLVFEADEYLFTLAPALADCIILAEPYTHYRLHGANLYMAPGSTADGERRKRRVLTALASELRRALPQYGVPPEVIQVLLEMVDAEAAQLRLKLDGGMPWETFRIETAIYRMQHASASRGNKIFRALTMIPALLLPARWFYAGRNWLGSQSWYKRARRDFLPSPQLTKIEPAPCPRDSRGR